MTNTINPSLFSGQYYQMPTTGGSSGGTTNSQSSAADALLQALDASSGGLLGNSNSQNSSSANAFLLDLSPQAQSLLGSFSGSGSATGTSSLLGGTNGFVLSAQQQQQIADILAKYKDAPFTQATFQQIQSDLKSAGLSPDQLAAQNEVLNIQATDSSYLLQALDGSSDSSNPVSIPDTSSLLNNEQSNANAYMQQIFSQWQSISTTAGAAGSTAGTGTSATSGTSLTA